MTKEGEVKLLGIEKVMLRLNEEALKITERTMKGMIMATIMIRRSMDKSSPKIPVDLGNLRASWFVVTSKGIRSKPPSFKGEDSGQASTDFSTAVGAAQSILQATKMPSVIMGFSANYAIIVHEDLESGIARDFKRPGSGSKFFEKAIGENFGKILKVIQVNAQIK